VPAVRGPLNGRAAGAGYRLRENERRAEDLEFGEDMLYTAAITAGWLTQNRDAFVDVDDGEVSVGVSRQQADRASASGVTRR
jgi:hypothetical protein